MTESSSAITYTVPQMPSARERWIVGLVATPVLFASFLTSLFIPDAERHARQFWTVDLLVFVVLPLAALGAVHAFTNVRPKDYGFVPLDTPTIQGQVLVQLAAAIGVYLLFTPLAQFAAQFWPPSAPKGGYLSQLLDGPYAVVARIYLSLSAALYEEVFFRGVLAFVFIGKHLSDRVLYVVLSSALFALSHFNQGGHVVFAAAIAGVAAALLYLRWRNLWYLIVAHFGAGLIAYGLA